MLEDSRSKIEEEGSAEVSVQGRLFVIKKQCLQDLEAHNMQPVIGDLRKALLIFHAPTDHIVRIENAGDIFQAAKHPKSFISLDDANHLLSRAEDSLYVGSVIAAWAEKYLEVLPEPKKAAPEKMQISNDKGFRTEIQVGPHSLVADEPPSVGGTGLGLTPYDLLSASLGACTAMTLRMYADRKKWPLESVLIEMDHHKVHAHDCETCETETGKVDIFSRTIEVKGALSEEQKERLLEIADKCPVHRTLHSEIQVETRTS
jgi:putative redox protein